MSNDISVLAFPMHGQQKLLSEGYRTRDGHLIEWFGRLTSEHGSVAVCSRPEPHYLRPLTARSEKFSPAFNTTSYDSYSWRIPRPWDRRKWWIQSRRSYNVVETPESTPAIIWNPLVAMSNAADRLFNGDRRIVVDLLDDWSIHYAFSSIKDQLEVAYARLFGVADVVTANSEGTASLARRFGRNDVKLITNGCDPDRFSDQSLASGPITVGYVGKIGNRVDLDLVLAVAAALPEVDFVFAGPILDEQYRRPLQRVPNIKLLGDIHYTDVPVLLQSFDIGWVPHRVGEFEVGGDVIKTYEYRASGLLC